MDTEGEGQGLHQEAEEEAWLVRSEYDFGLVVFLAAEDREKAPKALVVELVEHDHGAQTVKMAVAVISWVVSKVDAQEEPAVRAGYLVPVVERVVALLAVLALFLVPVLPASLASWELAQALVLLLALSVVLGDSDALQILAQAHSTMV